MRSGKWRVVSARSLSVQATTCILFSGDARFDLAPNTMVLRIQPDEGSTLLLNAKVPGLETRTQPVKMHFHYETTFGSNTPEAYERLILDSMVGDNTLFISGDETEASWRLITPIQDHWQDCGSTGLESYAATLGPSRIRTFALEECPSMAPLLNTRWPYLTKCLAWGCLSRSPRALREL